MRITANKSHGLQLPDYNIALDCRSGNAESIFISHAHSDHMPSNSGRSVYATHATSLLMGRRGFKGAVHSLAFNEPIELEKASVTLYPAGHILGSAMVFIETDEGSVLYTGDYRCPPSIASDGFQLPDKPIDYLITEATFGLPLYKWRPQNDLFDEIRDFADKTLKENKTPVFIAYNLGKSQELLMALAPLNRTVQVQPGCLPMCDVYKEAGLNLGRYELFNPDTAEGCIQITPSVSGNNGLEHHIRDIKIAYVSGWAALENRGKNMNADKLIALSDHIDFFELTALCEQIKPRCIYITHTPDPKVICHWLGEKGLNALPLEREQETYA